MSRRTSAARAALMLVLFVSAVALVTPAAAQAEPGWSGTVEVEQNTEGNQFLSMERKQLYVLDGVATEVQRDPDGHIVAWSQATEYVASVTGREVNPAASCGDGTAGSVITWSGGQEGTGIASISFRAPAPGTQALPYNISAGEDVEGFYDVTGTFTCGSESHQSAIIEVVCGPPDFSTLAPVPTVPDYATASLSGTRAVDAGLCDSRVTGGTITWNLTRLPDQDCDGIPDSQDPVDTDGPCGNDRDGDGLTNDYELSTSHTDPDDKDSDNDGLGDGDEVGRGTDPKAVDTDGDGLSDGEEVFIGSDPKKVDTDGDGLGDGDEVSRGTDPRKTDTDGGGTPDGVEVFTGTNPRDASDDQQPACSEGRFVNPTYTASVPGIELFSFQPSFTFCFGDRTALVRRVNIHGDVIAGVVTQTVLERLGFTLAYTPPTEPPRLDGRNASALGGQFSIAFDAVTLFDRLGARTFVQKKLGKKLEKVLAKSLKRYGPSYRELRAIRVAQLEVKSKVLLEVDKLVRRASAVLPAGLRSRLRTFVKEKVADKLESTFETVNAAISARGMANLSAEEISTAVVDGVLAGLAEAFIWHFPVWEPEYRIEVFPGGTYIESAEDPFQNPFIAISKTP